MVCRMGHGEIGRIGRRKALCRAEDTLASARDGRFRRSGRRRRRPRTRRPGRPGRRRGGTRSQTSHRRASRTGAGLGGARREVIRRARCQVNPIQKHISGRIRMKNANRTIMLVLSCLAATMAGGVFGQDWPQWRGPNRDGKAPDFKAPKAWPKELTQKWKVSVGDGAATPALVGDKLYVFSRQEGNEVLRCL